jgi:hypothetical protein
MKLAAVGMEGRKKLFYSSVGAFGPSLRFKQGDQMSLAKKIAQTMF